MERRDPLLIPEINCKIFKFLPFEEKKKWRALSRTFHDETVTPWSKAMVFVLSVYRLKEHVRILKEGRNVAEEEMQLREAPISNLDIRLLIPTVVLPAYTDAHKFDPSRDLTFFLERSGSALESLRIDARFRQDRFVDFFKWVLKYCKNLKELSIRSGVVADGDKRQNLFEEDEEILEVAERIETFAISFKNKFATTKAKEIEICKGILTFLPNIKQLKVGDIGLTRMLSALPFPLHSNVENQKFIYLQDLEIDVKEEDIRELMMEGFRSLRVYMKRAKPELRRLKMTNFIMESVRCPPYYFHQFISDCKFTLTRLELSFTGFCNSPTSCWISDLTGIDFEKLTHLILVEKGSYMKYVEKFDFRALRGMKKLKVFRCIAEAMEGPLKEGTTFQKGDLEFHGGVKEFDWAKQLAARNKVNLGREVDPPLLEDLEELSFFLRGKFSADAVRQLGKWMPSVKKLGLIADQTLFPVIFEVWGGSLDRLFLLGPTNVTEELIEETTKGKTVQVEVLNREQCFEKYNEKIF